MSETNLPAPFLDLPETGQDIVDVAKIHASMSVEMLNNYDRWCTVTLGRYALERVTIEDLQKEHDEELRLRNFITETIDMLPSARNKEIYAADVLEADKLAVSLVKFGYDIYYSLGTDKTFLYLAKPKSKNEVSSKSEDDPDTLVTKEVTSSSSTHTLHIPKIRQKELMKVTKQMELLVDPDNGTDTLRLTDEDIRRMYDPYKKTINVDTILTRLYEESRDPYGRGLQTPPFMKIGGKAMNDAGIFRQLLLLSVRFGVYDQYVQQLEGLSNDIMAIRETPPEERERMQQSIKQMFAVAVEHRDAHPIEATEEDKKRKGIFGRRAKKV